jgi:hypothetical protein
MLFSLILFNLYSKYLTKKVLEGFGDFKIGGQVIRTEKYVDDLVVQRRKQCYRACLIDELKLEYAVEWKSTWTDYCNKNFKATAPNADNDSSKTTGGCRIFQLFG